MSGAARSKERDARERKQRRTFVKLLNKRSAHEDAEIKELSERIARGAPAPGTNPLALGEEAAKENFAAARSFDELPLSEYTKVRLSRAASMRAA